MSSEQSYTRHVCSIIPAYILQALADNDASHHHTRGCAQKSIEFTRNLRRGRKDESHRRRNQYHTTSSDHHEDDYHDRGGRGRGNNDHDQTHINGHTSNASIVQPMELTGIAGTGTDDTHSESVLGGEPVGTATAATTTTTSTSAPIPKVTQAIATTAAAAAAAAAAAPVLQALKLNRSIYDCQFSRKLPGMLVRSEGSVSSQTSDMDSSQVYDAFATTLNFLYTIFQRNSLDNAGLALLGSIRYDDEKPPNGFDNALWTGTQMIFGQGDGLVFGSFTASLDVVAHELTHGLVQYTANIPYHLQAGALNEHVADAVASMVKQWNAKQTVDQADWLIGAEIILPSIRRRFPLTRAIRDLANPGTAHRGQPLTDDPQPAHMDNYKVLPDDDKDPLDDDGGVHINSGIPNHAFYLACMAVGGNSWETCGPIWFATLTDPKLASFVAELKNYANCFAFFADLTVTHALDLFGEDVRDKVQQAWIDVGVLEQ